MCLVYLNEMEENEEKIYLKQTHLNWARIISKVKTAYTNVLMALLQTSDTYRSIC